MSLKWIIIAVLALPAAELVLFIVVAAEIGFLRAFVLQLAISAAGALVLRQTGSARLAELRAEVGTGGRLPGPQGIHVIAGILLLIPGFITDLLGLALLVPPLRQGLGALALGALARWRRAKTPDPVIDLAPDEWRDITTKKPARRRRRITRP